MKKKRKKTRLNPADDLGDFQDIIRQSLFGGGDNGEIIEFRPRSSSQESDWREVPKDHLFNQDRFNYRLTEPPRITLQDDGETVETDDGDTRPLPWAKRIIAIARKCRKSKKEIVIKPEDKDGDREEVVIIRRNGDVKVGCQFFSWQELDTFSKKVGRK